MPPTDQEPLDIEMPPDPDQEPLDIEMPADDEAPGEEGMELDMAELMGEPKIDSNDPETEEFYKNLAEDMSEQAKRSLADDLLESFDDDAMSRKDWLQTYVDGLELLGLRIENRTEPWPGACGVFHPLLSEALVKFQAETIMSTFPAAGPVKAIIIGKETPAKKQAAINVTNDMNFQLMEVMTEYRPEQERLLWGLGLSGNAFKKVYYDPALERQVALYVPAEDLVVPYGASNLETAERVTHVMRKTKNEVLKLQASGFYVDVDLGSPTKGDLDSVEKKIAENMGFNATSDDRFKLLEMHVNLDLEEYDEHDKETDNDDGAAEGSMEMGAIARPYIVTIEKGSQTVLSIYRNWIPEDKRMVKREHFVHYPYIPGFGFYAFGLVHLLGSFAKSGTSLIRQLVDAGTLSNLPGGFKTKGMRIKGDDTPIAPGEFRDVDVASGTIKDNIMTLPYKEPSQVLFTLLQNIVDEGRKFASTTDLNVSDMSAQAPVGTTLAILERTLKVMSSVQARIHYAMKREFKLLAVIIRDYTPKEYTYEPEEGDRRAKQADYDVVEVIPVSDPNASTMAQKVTQYQAVMQLAQGSPQIYDMPELHRQMLEVLGIKNIGKIIPTEDDLAPKDPVSENMALLAGKPVKAFMYQDHESHISVHMAAAQDPKIGALLENNPQAPSIMAAAMAHVAEHIGFEYRRQIEVELGVPLPPVDEKLPEEVEVQLSKLVAQASAQLAQKNQAEAQQQAQQAAAEDPLNIIQRAELDLKGKELEHKIEVDKADISLNLAKLVLETKKAEAESENKDNALTMKSILEGVKMVQETTGKTEDRTHATSMKTQDQTHATSMKTQDQTHATEIQTRNHAQAQADALQREKFANKTKPKAAK